MKIIISKKNKPLVVITIVIFVIASFVNLLNNSMVEKDNCYGIGVDSTGQLYVAKEGIIEVYNQEHTKINEINSKYSGPKKRITIRDDEILVLIATGDYCYKRVDFAGNDLSDWIYVSKEEYYRLEDKSYVFETETGDVYEYNDDKYQYRILLNKETVIYEEPLSHAILRTLLVVTYLIALPLIGFTTFRLSKENDWKKKKSFW